MSRRPLHLLKRSDMRNLGNKIVPTLETFTNKLSPDIFSPGSKFIPMLKTDISSTNKKLFDIVRSNVLPSSKIVLDSPLGIRPRSTITSGSNVPPPGSTPNLDNYNSTSMKMFYKNFVVRPIINVVLSLCFSVTGTIGIFLYLLLSDSDSSSRRSRKDRKEEEDFYTEEELVQFYEIIVKRKIKEEEKEKIKETVSYWKWATSYLWGWKRGEVEGKTENGEVPKMSREEFERDVKGEEKIVKDTIKNHIWYILPKLKNDEIIGLVRHTMQVRMTKTAERIIYDIFEAISENDEKEPFNQKTKGTKNSNIQLINTQGNFNPKDVKIRRGLNIDTKMLRDLERSTKFFDPDEKNKDNKIKK